MHEYASGQRKHLCLVLQSPEWGGENKSVIVPEKVRTVISVSWVDIFHSQAFACYKSFPIHLFHLFCFKFSGFSQLFYLYHAGQQPPAWLVKKLEKVTQAAAEEIESGVKSAKKIVKKVKKEAKATIVKAKKKINTLSAWHF